MDLPIYEITFDPANFESGVDAIALTETPAIEMFGMRFQATAVEGNAEEIQMKYFADAEKMIVAGPAMIPNKPIYRKEGNKEFYVVFSAETIERMAAKFNEEFREYKFNIEHNENQVVAGFVKENWIVEDSEKDKSALYGFSLPIGTWFIFAKITDQELWNSVIKQMDSVGFSVEGLMGLTNYNFIQKTKNENMNKETVKRKKFFAKRISTKKRFNVTEKKFEEVLVSEDEEVLIVEEMAEGAAVEVLNEDAQMVTAEDGTYEIPSEGIVIEVLDGEIENIDSLAAPAEETEMAKDEEEEEKNYQMDPEMIAKIIELESRIEAIEAKLAETAETEEAFEKVARFSKDAKKAERLSIIQNLLK